MTESQQAELWASLGIVLIYASIGVPLVLGIIALIREERQAKQQSNKTRVSAPKRPRFPSKGARFGSHAASRVD